MEFKTDVIKGYDLKTFITKNEHKFFYLDSLDFDELFKILGTNDTENLEKMLARGLLRAFDPREVDEEADYSVSLTQNYLFIKR